MRPPDFGIEHKAAIKNEIESIFGRCITSNRDCIDLSDDIFKKTQKQLNPNTLRRIFGLVKADYPPSQSTLAILSGYCGFYSVDELYALKQKANKTDIFEQERLLNYVVGLFVETPVKDPFDKIYLTFVKHTICFLNYNVTLADKFSMLVAKSRNGQDLYFEHFVNVDKLNSYYGKGLRYYLHGKRTEEASLFAHSLITLKYWLNNDREKVLRQCDHLLCKKPSPASTAPRIFCRYFAALLFCQETAAANVEETLIDIYKYYSSLDINTDREQLIYFEYVIAEALILTGHYQDALFYLSNYRKSFVKSEYCNFITSFNNLKLLEALAHYRTGDVKNAERIFDEIRTSDFHFLNKQFAGILYLELMNKLKRRNGKSLETKTKLVKQTGFIRLDNFLD